MNVMLAVLTTISMDAFEQGLDFHERGHYKDR